MSRNCLISRAVALSMSACAWAVSWLKSFKFLSQVSYSSYPEIVVQVSWRSREKNGRCDWSARTGWKALRRCSLEHTVTVYIWIMNSQSRDNHAVWTKRHLQGLSRASLGAPVVASSTMDGGGGCKGYFKLHVFLGGKCSIPPLNNAWAGSTHLTPIPIPLFVSYPTLWTWSHSSYFYPTILISIPLLDINPTLSSVYLTSHYHSSCIYSHWGCIDLSQKPGLWGHCWQHAIHRAYYAPLSDVRTSGKGHLALAVFRCFSCPRPSWDIPRHPRMS